MLDWRDLCNLSDTELGRLDVAEVNLACARGLPGSESLNVAFCLRTLDAWARRIGQHTQQMKGLFERHPERFEHSWGRFCIMDMITVLQRDLGVSYLISSLSLNDEVFFSRPEHSFVHGILQGNGGTCASLPVLYLAIGRRLGYPLKMAETCQHRFARWEEEGEWFNIECTSRGLVCHSDEYYRFWPRLLTDQEIKHHRFLRSQSPRDELGSFLLDRGIFLVANRRWWEALEPVACAHEFDPENWRYRGAVVNAMNAWDRQLRTRLVPGFPALSITMPPRQFPALPIDLSRGWIHLIIKENLLSNPDLDRRWWEPLRRDPLRRPPDLPALIEVVYPQDGSRTPPEFILHHTLPAWFLATPRRPA